VNAHPEKFLGKRVLIVGGGYSAITTIAHLRALVEAQNDKEEGQEAKAEGGAGEVWNPNLIQLLLRLHVK
jgi:hypothetical protein